VVDEDLASEDTRAVRKASSERPPESVTISQSMAMAFLFGCPGEGIGKGTNSPRGIDLFVVFILFAVPPYGMVNRWERRVLAG
jgi:hypothetical protein